MVKVLKGLTLFCLLGLCVFAYERADANNSQYYRQYYGGWNYYPQYRYYYRSYYYKPYSSYGGYRQHYCVYYPSYSQHVYYYNPYQRVYWGRLDVQGKEGAQYSLLAEDDRKGKLADIPEDKFPKPGPMPTVPESEDGTAITPPPDLDDLPKEPPQ